MADATTLVIFGAGGDLTSRLLLPALGQLLTREPSRAVRIVGADREDWTDADLEAVGPHGVRDDGCRGGRRPAST